MPSLVVCLCFSAPLIAGWLGLVRVGGGCRPQPKYAPWFGVVLKCARLAVKVLGALSEEVTAPASTCPPF